MCLRSAVSTGHVVALRTTRAEVVVPRGCSETRGQVSMYTRLYVPGAQCKLIPFTDSQRVCRVVTLSSCRPHRQHFREKHSPSRHYILVQRLTIVRISVIHWQATREVPQINGLNTSFLSFSRFLRLEESRQNCNKISDILRVQRASRCGFINKWMPEIEARDIGDITYSILFQLQIHA